MSSRYYGPSEFSLISSIMSQGIATSGAPQKHRAFIALGSNLGDRVEMIEEACRRMSDQGIRVVRTSGLWESEPMYVLDQDRFVNGVCEVRLGLFYASRCL
jgi:2-amino-4-hydroxy-6-hydroxymethyldihydropteridine diphosphokinase/dihydropteroate synthase